MFFKVLHFSSAIKMPKAKVRLHQAAVMCGYRRSKHATEHKFALLAIEVFIVFVVSVTVLPSWYRMCALRSKLGFTWGSAVFSSIQACIFWALQETPFPLFSREDTYHCKKRFRKDHQNAADVGKVCSCRRAGASHMFVSAELSDTMGKQGWWELFSSQIFQDKLLARRSECSFTQAAFSPAG